jgi:hypothetical protein
MAETEIIENQPLPFATVVIHDHAGLDIESHLDRNGIFRVNLIGRKVWSTPGLNHDGLDYAAINVVIPGPMYASQSLGSDPQPVRTDEQACRSGSSWKMRLPWQHVDTLEGWDALQG